MEKISVKAVLAGIFLAGVALCQAQNVLIDENFQKWQNAGHYSNSKDFEYVSGKQDIICADGVSRTFIYTDCIVKPKAKAEGACSKGAILINKKSKSNGALELPELPSVQRISFSRIAKPGTWLVLEVWDGNAWKKADEAKSEQQDGCVVSEFNYNSKSPVKLRIRVDGSKSNSLCSLQVAGF